MNYERTYNQLCERSQSRKWVKFSNEKHHIIPKSMGGANIKSNIAILTPREHALAHLLLVKFLTGKHKAKMVCALKAMIGYRTKNRNQLSTQQYETLRQAYQTLSNTPEYSAWRSEITKAQWTPERRAAVSEKARQQWINGQHDYHKSNEYRTLKSKQTKERWQDPEYAKKQSDWTRAQWKDPNKRPNR